MILGNISTFPQWIRFRCNIETVHVAAPIWTWGSPVGGLSFCLISSLSANFRRRNLPQQKGIWLNIIGLNLCFALKSVRLTLWENLEWTWKRSIVKSWKVVSEGDNVALRNIQLWSRRQPTLRPLWTVSTKRRTIQPPLTRIQRVALENWGVRWEWFETGKWLRKNRMCQFSNVFGVKKRGRGFQARSPCVRKPHKNKGFVTS